MPPRDADAAASIPRSVGDAARELAVDEATLYRWIHAGLVPVSDPGVEGAPLRVRMTDELRARFRPEVPSGFVPVATAMRRLGVTRQTLWNRIKASQLASCHVTRGSQRGLYVRLEEFARCGVACEFVESPPDDAAASRQGLSWPGCAGGDPEINDSLKSWFC